MKRVHADRLLRRSSRGNGPKLYFPMIQKKERQKERKKKKKDNCLAIALVDCLIYATIPLVFNLSCVSVMKRARVKEIDIKQSSSLSLLFSP